MNELKMFHNGELFDSIATGYEISAGYIEYKLARQMEENSNDPADEFTAELNNGRCIRHYRLNKKMVCLDHSGITFLNTV